ncbi:TonB-dependent receptor [uncultured Algimonas sp.]|uniref:TonB-dependent receptor n=1 Tax=uncultured Algimonas sp. TaxID=1547920 RepID=UPI00262947E6|nr:TonB-dependent receptor [uncultured Algimonas sp.]
MIKTRSLLATSTATLALLATPAYAQDNIGDEVIVTATKRQTTLQDTPVAVSVTPAEVIEKAQILDIKDLQSVVPTFRVSQLQNSANSTLIIRGFGNGGNNIGIEPSVGLFVDGVYRSRAAAQIGDLPNLERIEILSGPQSTLFGKNASAGVVSVVTAEPDFESNGYIEGGVGNYDLVYGKAYITGAVGEDVAVSLGGGFQKRDGYFKPAAGTAGGDFNDLNRFNIRGQALWTPTDDLSLRLIADLSTIDENCCGTNTPIVGPTAGIIAALGGAVPGVPNPFGYFTSVNRATDNEIDDQGISLQIDKDAEWLGGVNFTSITAFRNNKSAFDSDSDFTSLELLENVFQDVRIDTFTQEFRLASTGAGRLGWLVGGFYFNEDISQFSGLDYGSQLRGYIDALASQGASLRAGPTASPLFGIEQSLGFAPGTFFGDQVVVDENFNQDNESFSIFANVDYELTDRFTLTLGGSYVEDEKNVSVTNRNNDVFSNLSLTGADGTRVVATNIFVNGAPGVPSFSAALGGLPFTAANLQTAATGGFGAAAAAYVAQVQAGAAARVAGPDNPFLGLIPLQFQPQFLSFPNSVEDGRTKDDDFTYTVKGAYEVNDNFNVYASTSTGFKASSWNLTRDSRPFLANGPALQAAGLLPNNYNVATGRNFGTRFAGPEEATVYEAGLKARFEWGAFNIAVFDQTIEGFQSTIFQGTGFVLANAGEQSTQGIEFDSTFTPIDGVTLGVAGLIQDPVYDEYTSAPVIRGSAQDLTDGVVDGIGDLSGEAPAGINEVSLSFAAQYEFDLTDAVGMFLRADYQYEDEIQVVDNIPGLTRDTRNLNASFGFEFEDGLDLRFWGRNITGHETFTSGFPGVVQAGTVSSYPNQPATYGVSLRKNF